MTHPLTPREKVARMAAEAFHNGYQSYDQCDETMRMRFDWIADMIVGSPALASGSGDHAELIDRLRSTHTLDTPRSVLTGTSVNPDGPVAADTIEALLAEIAALDDYGRDVAKEALEYRNRATEAERKLAEAVGLLEDLSSWFTVHPGSGRAWSIPSGYLGVDDAVNAARTFLSKEAER